MTLPTMLAAASAECDSSELSDPKAENNAASTCGYARLCRNEMFLRVNVKLLKSITCI